MSKKILNPFRGLPGYDCFGCSPDNENGLRLNFTDEGTYIKARWKPRQYFQGYNNILHGGIQSTLMDEIASWFVYAKLKTAGLTSRLEVRYKKPVYTDRGEISLSARLKEQKRNLADIEVELFDHEDTLCAVGLVQYFTFSDQVARERFFYPGPDAFYE